MKEATSFYHADYEVAFDWLTKNMRLADMGTTVILPDGSLRVEVHGGLATLKPSGAGWQAVIMTVPE